MPRLVVVSGPPGDELSWEGAAASRRSYVPLPEPKLVLDSLQEPVANLEQALAYVELGDRRA